MKVFPQSVQQSEMKEMDSLLHLSDIKNRLTMAKKCDYGKTIEKKIRAGTVLSFISQQCSYQNKIFYICFK